MTSREMIAAGYEARREERAEEARALFAEAWEDAKDYGERVDAMRGWANSESDLEELDAAAAKYGEAISLLRGLNEPLKLAHTVRHLGDVQRRAGRLTEALPTYEEALAIYREHPEAGPLDAGNALRGYGLLLEAIGESARARETWVEVLRIYREVGVQDGIDEAERQIQKLDEA